MEKERAHICRSWLFLKTAVAESRVRDRRLVFCFDVGDAPAPHVVTGRMSKRMDERPTLSLSCRIASRPQQCLLDDKATLVISLDVPHQYLCLGDGVCDAIELPKLGFDVLEDLVRRPRWPFKGAARPKQHRAQRRSEN